MNNVHPIIQGWISHFQQQPEYLNVMLDVHFRHNPDEVETREELTEKILAGDLDSFAKILDAIQLRRADITVHRPSGA